MGSSVKHQERERDQQSGGESYRNPWPESEREAVELHKTTRYQPFQLRPPSSSPSTSNRRERSTYSQSRSEPKEGRDRRQRNHASDDEVSEKTHRLQPFSQTCELRAIPSLGVNIGLSETKEQERSKREAYESTYGRGPDDDNACDADDVKNYEQPDHAHTHHHTTHRKRQRPPTSCGSERAATAEGRGVPDERLVSPLEFGVPGRKRLEVVPCLMG
jgi:hypothetical protein